jgi:hypothetical protein
METTCRLVAPSRDIEDEAVWSPHAASFPLLPAALKTRWCGVHTPPRLASFLGHRRRGGVESTHRLVYPLSWGIEDEAMWSPHAASFPLFPGASKTRRRGAHTPPRFPSSPRYRGRGGVEHTSRLVSLLHCGIEDEAAWSPHAASFPLFTAASKTRRHETHTPPCFFSFPQRQPCLGSFYIFLPVFRITIFSLMADSCSTKYIIVLPYHEYYQ